MKMILGFLGAAIFGFSSRLVLLSALSFLGYFGFESLSRRPLKKDAASIRARIGVFVFKTLYLWHTNKKGTTKDVFVPGNDK
ncbi:MAG: hypothetical protein KA264_08080 [Crocinitomicaceae bacterium]|nr:hypothetical protein [Crocinitomicaceae bacterium]